MTFFFFQNLKKRLNRFNFFHSSIRFAVVSEPVEQDGDCEDIGFAFVDINDILEQNSNFINKEIERKFEFLI